MDANGTIWPPGCGRTRARTRGGAGQKIAEKALDTANQLANVMASHVELQREQLRATSTSSSSWGGGSSHHGQDTSVGVSWPFSCVAWDLHQDSGWWDEQYTFTKRQRKW